MITRRTLLRGMLGGAAVSVALPAFEAAMNSSGTAWADGSGFPCRFGLFFWGNGMLPGRWVPTTTGPEWVLSPQLQPLADVKSRVTLITGMEVKLTNLLAHVTGAAGLLSGAPAIAEGDDYTYAGPSLDQRIAAEIGGATLYRSVEVGVQPGVRGLSHNGPDSLNPPESDPIALYERLFGPTFRQPGEGGAVDPELGLRRSVLDAVVADADRLSARLGQRDRDRLDQHLTAVRDLELRLARLEEDPPELAACVRPEPPVAIPDVDGRPQMPERARLMAELTAMAWACDLTRVTSLWYSDPLNDVLYPDATAGHHQLTHDEPGDQPTVDAIVQSAVGSFADLLAALDAVPEGDGTLLDHAVVLGTSDVSAGRTHSIQEFPLLLGGTAGGRIRNGIHHRSEVADSVSHVPLTLLRALGIAAASYGEDTAFVDSGLSEVEA
jgi:hypothetical protein